MQQNQYERARWVSTNLFFSSIITDAYVIWFSLSIEINRLDGFVQLISFKNVSECVAVAVTL